MSYLPEVPKRKTKVSKELRERLIVAGFTSMVNKIPHKASQDMSEYELEQAPLRVRSAVIGVMAYVDALIAELEGK